jgi:hypothetical protein
MDLTLVPESYVESVTARTIAGNVRRVQRIEMSVRHLRLASNPPPQNNDHSQLLPKVGDRLDPLEANESANNTMSEPEEAKNVGDGEEEEEEVAVVKEEESTAVFEPVVRRRSSSVVVDCHFSSRHFWGGRPLHCSADTASLSLPCRSFSKKWKPKRARRKR